MEIILFCITILLGVEKIYAKPPSYKLKLIETIEKDTTGKGINDKIKILADEKINWSEVKNNLQIEDNWRLKVMLFKLQGTKISPEERIMEVQTKLIDKGKREYKINNFKIK